MGDILKGGQQQVCNSVPVSDEIDLTDFLRHSQYLGEFSEEALLPDGTTFNEKAKARDNLDIYSRSEVEDMVDTEHDHMLDTVNSTMRSHLDATDPHGDRAYTDSKIQQQSQTINTQINTVRSNLESTITRSLLGYLKSGDFETFKSQITRDIALQLDSVYKKNKVYTKEEINSLNQQFVKKDGSVPFIKPQEGIDPKLDRHLATKRYVDNAFSHATDFLNNIEFRTWINQKLAAYAKLSDTYSRDTIDNKLEDLVDSVVDTAVNRALTDILQTHINAEDPHGDRAYVDANFVSKESLSELSPEDIPNVTNTLREEITSEINQSIEEAQPVWETSGPVQATVGFVEDGSDFDGKAFTLQGIMDAIFYGKLVQIHAAEQVVLGSTTDVTVSIHGSTETVRTIIIKQGNTVIAELEASDLDNTGQATVRSNYIMEDTTFTVEVYYYDISSPTTASTIVKVGYGVFVGIIDKYTSASTITWADLKQLTLSDPTNNKFFATAGDGVPDIEMDFDFASSTYKQILVAVPATHPSISEMSTSSQQFGIDAFNVINQIPLSFELESGDTQSVLYKYMVYKEGIITLSTKVTFKF